MATYKKLNGIYTIESPEVIINGKLTVLGEQSSIQSNNTFVTDRIISLNAGETAPGVGSGFPHPDDPAGKIAGFEVDRGSLTNVGLHYNETLGQWRLSKDGNIWLNIYAGNSTTALGSVEEDPNPTLGGNLKTNGYFIISNVADNIKFDGNLQLSYTTTTPSTVANTVVFYSSTPSGGTTGLYVVNSDVTNEELITKKRAFGYSMIL